MGNEVSTMDMAEFDAQNQIVSGEASPLLLPRCIRPDLFKITICDLEQGAWTEHQIQAMWAISPFISRISGGGSGRACRGLSGKRHSCRFPRWGEASRRAARHSPKRRETFVCISLQIFYSLPGSANRMDMVRFWGQDK